MIKFIQRGFMAIGVTAILLLTGNFASAQTTNTLDQTLITLQKQAADQPYEKVYLHMDKPYYGAGDTLWFKAYVVTGARHYLSGISYVLNVDLVNEQNIIRKSIKLPIANGLTRGDFILGDTIPEGNYRIRAYTNWMRNAGPEYFFDKTFKIVNSISNEVFTRSAYTYTLNNGQQTVNVTINYTDLNGKPYANKEVKYEVDLDPKRVAKGKGITDDKGGLVITFTNPEPGILSAGQIITAIQLNDQKIINKTVAIKATSTKADLQFFPESGNLVNGIISKIAFKAIGADGLGVDAKGTISDGQGNEVTTFSSTHLGMGMFMFTPQPGKSYKANVIYADGSKDAVALPQALDHGYVLAITNADSLNNVIVQITGNGESQSGSLVLVARSGGEIFFEGKSKPGASAFTAVIPKSKFPSGIVQFTLFSGSGEPVNERLIFIQNPDKLKLALTSSLQSYSPRQRVKIDINVKDRSGKPVRGSFSASVINETTIPVEETAEGSILSSILLTSDIKGYIEKPNYYFTNINATTAADLDILMLTQGYHRYEWKEIMSNTPANIIFKPEKSITISGTVKSFLGKPIVKGKVSLFSNSEGLFLVDTITDKNGRFSFGMAFKDSTTFTIKALAANGRDNVILDLDKAPPLTGGNKNRADIQVSIDNGLEQYLQNNKKQYDADVKYGVGDRSIFLKEITISRLKVKSPRQLAEEKAVEFSDNLNGAGQANQIITADDIAAVGGSTIFDCLNGRMAGVEVRTDSTGNQGFYSMRGSDQMNSRAQPMVIIIDGIFGRDISLIAISNIQSIEVLRSMNLLSAYGSRASNGILVVTTKRGDKDSPFTKIDNDFISCKPRGYYKALQFYSPKYTGPKTNAQIIDLRSTIFWNPLIETDKDGNTSFEYFNADSKGTYRVVVEGIDYKTGTLGRQVYRYKVE